MAHFTPPTDSESHPHTTLMVIRDGRVADARSAAAYPDSAGSFSPDAARVVYASDAGLNVVALSREGPDSVTHLTPSVAESLAACDETPAWSPDGTHIAFVRCGALSTIPPSGGNVRRIVPGRANNPTWSPDGRRIAFDDGRRVRIVARRGGRVRLLAAGTDPAWSPDGATIAAVRNGDVWLVDARSGRARLAVRNASQPAWRPRR